MAQECRPSVECLDGTGPRTATRLATVWLSVVSAWRRTRRPERGWRAVPVNWFSALLLLLHIGGAIIAFGPVFTFPLIGSMGAKEPMHANFAVRLSERISQRQVLPLAIFQGVTGV